MKAFKSIFRLILAGGLCLGLAACGTEDTGGGRGSESGQMEEGQGGRAEGKGKRSGESGGGSGSARAVRALCAGAGSA